MSHHELDARNLLCPMPVIRVQNKVNQLQPGDTLTVTCTDPGVKQDIPTWCRINHHTLVGEPEERDGEIIITVQVGES